VSGFFFFKRKNRKYLPMKNRYLNNLTQYLHSYKINLFAIPQVRMLLSKAVSILQHPITCNQQLFNKTEISTSQSMDISYIFLHNQK